jgi:hypothetical protein
MSFQRKLLKRTHQNKTDNWNGGKYVQGRQLLDSVHCVPKQTSVTIILQRSTRRSISLIQSKPTVINLYKTFQ